MKRLAGLFSALSLLCGIVALAAILLGRPAPAPLAPLSGPVDRLVIEKSARRLTAFRGGIALRSYPVALGFAALGHKTQQGDGRTPEGFYKVDRRNQNSAFHLSLGLNYPRPEDRARAAALNQSPGGDIFIHGQPNALPIGAMLRGDWTAGCIALSNPEIEELWRVVAIGTPVEIRP